jgi:hypothetical protein
MARLTGGLWHFWVLGSVDSGQKTGEAARSNRVAPRAIGAGGRFGCSGAEVGPVYPSPLRLSDACPYGKTLSRATVDAVLAHADR